MPVLVGARMMMRNHIFIPDELWNLQDRGFRSLVYKFLGILQILSGGPQDQNYFHNINMLFAFFTVLTLERVVQKQWWAPAIPLLGIYPKELKKSIQKSTYTQGFLTVTTDSRSLNVHQQMNG